MPYFVEKETDAVKALDKAIRELNNGIQELSMLLDYRLSSLYQSVFNKGTNVFTFRGGLSAVMNNKTTACFVAAFQSKQFS